MERPNPTIGTAGGCGCGGKQGVVAVPHVLHILKTNSIRQTLKAVMYGMTGKDMLKK